MHEHMLQFIHRAISDVCDKEGVHYEDFAKLLSLAEYSKLYHSLTSIIRQLARAGVRKEEVGREDGAREGRREGGGRREGDREEGREGSKERGREL